MNKQQELKSLQELKAALSEEYNVLFKKQREIEDRIYQLHIDLFIESGVLSKIEWVADLNSRNNILLTPDDDDSTKYEEWHRLFLESYHSDSNHYQISAGSVKVVVNDNDVVVSAEKDFTILDVIEEFGLTITKNRISDSRAEMEAKLQNLKDLELIINSPK